MYQWTHPTVTVLFYTITVLPLGLTRKFVTHEKLQATFRSRWGSNRLSQLCHVSWPIDHGKNFQFSITLFKNINTWLKSSINMTTFVVFNRDRISYNFWDHNGDSKNRTHRIIYYNIINNVFLLNIWSFLSPPPLSLRSRLFYFKRYIQNWQN